MTQEARAAEVLAQRWLTALVAAELGVTGETRLDEESREVVAGDRRIGLSPLEFDVLRYLWAHEGKVIDRAALLEACWEPDYDGGSNVVDVVMRGLRRKLGDRAAMIETLRGTGTASGARKHQSFPVLPLPDGPWHSADCPRHGADHRARMRAPVEHPLPDTPLLTRPSRTTRDPGGDSLVREP